MGMASRVTSMPDHACAVIARYRESMGITFVVATTAPSLLTQVFLSSLRFLG